MKMRTAALVAVLFLSAGCAEKIQDAPKAGTTMLVQEFEWRIINEAQMRELHVINNIKVAEGKVPVGIQGYKDGKAIIYTLPPKSVDDDVALTLGHEVMHITMGKYHD